MMTRFFVIGCLALLAAAASALAGPSTCEQLKGHTFTSLNDHELGENRHGIVWGKWTIVFSKDTAELKAREHDYFVEGAYLCNDTEGNFAVDKGVAGKWVGYFQPETKLILFQGNWYSQTN